MNKNYYKILEYFGDENQRKKAVEELAELQIAILKGDKANIIEEIADVRIMLGQMMISFGIEEIYVGFAESGKLSRTLKRIKSGYYNKENEK